MKKQIKYCRLIVILILLICLYSCRKWDNPYDKQTDIKIEVKTPCLVEISHALDIELKSDARQKFNVKLELYKGNIFICLIADNTPCSNSYSWTVLSTCVSGGDYRIKASCTINSDLYQFSEYFTIANWNDLSAVSPSFMTTFFKEDFNDNSNGWPTSNSDYSCSLNSGIYKVISNISTSAIINTPVILFDPSKNFQFELSVKYTGNASAYAGFFWGAGDQSFNDYYEFLHYNNTNYFYGVDHYPNWTTYISSNSSNINNGYNTIVIRKIGTNYYFFVNGHFLFTYTFQSCYGGYFGFELYPNATLYVDYLHIYYISTSCN
jgi:hypothetical protein